MTGKDTPEGRQIVHATNARADRVSEGQGYVRMWFDVAGDVLEIRLSKTDAHNLQRYLKKHVRGI